MCVPGATIVATTTVQFVLPVLLGHQLDLAEALEEVWSSGSCTKTSERRRFGSKLRKVEHSRQQLSTDVVQGQQ